jgi:hypothetical protein
MSFIFKKLSVILCCLFCLVSLNSVVSAKPGDYLVYFLGKDENSLRCNKCGNYFSNMARIASCPYYCMLCSGGSIFSNTDCGSCYYYEQNCCSSHNSCHDLFVKYGPFCFMKYENGGNIDIVFENAKKNKQLCCLGCVLENINDSWCGKLFSNIDDTNFANCFELKTIRSKIFDIIESRKNKLISEYCPGHYSEVKMMLNRKYITIPKYILNPEHKK